MSLLPEPPTTTPNRTPCARLFYTQERFADLLDAGSATLQGDALEVSAYLCNVPALRYAVATAVIVVAELTTLDDAAGLVGKVKTMDELAALGAEYVEGSIVLGDAAYQTREGFLMLAMLQVADPMPEGQAVPAVRRRKNTARDGGLMEGVHHDMPEQGLGAEPGHTSSRAGAKKASQPPSVGRGGSDDVPSPTMDPQNQVLDALAELFLER